MADCDLPYSSAKVRKLDHVQFGVFGPDEIRRMSVAEIKHEKPYENGIPKHESIADRRLGANGLQFPCLTCYCDDKSCPGHFGHIELAAPVFNIGFLNTTLKVLRCVCFYCSKLLVVEPTLTQLRKMKNPASRLRVAAKTGSAQKVVCLADHKGCGNVQPKFSRDGFRLRATYPDAAEDSAEKKQPVTAEKVLEVFRRMSDEDIETIGLSPKFSRPEWFILKLLPVPPPQVRPSVMKGGLRSEDDLTNKLGDIVKNNNALRALEASGGASHILREMVDLIQYHVATYMNNDLPGVTPATVRGGSRSLKSIGQRFKGKEGRVRGNLMGKRVDFSARTVITPDPNLKLHEVGVPFTIAQNLTYPEVVTAFNMSDMKQLVENGPSTYPGAKYIQRDDGFKVNLQYVTNRAELQLEIGYTVIRHIRDGDFVLFNRQPSLHKMSIMGHRIKVMHYSTFRLNLSVTSPYNADFDGDEMNLHVPQSHQTRAEVMELMLVPHNIVSPQGNKPVMGIVQDSLLGCMLFTQRDTFIRRDLMMNLLMHVGDWDGVIPEPAIYKPEPLWTGKQIFSLILPNVNITRYANAHPDGEKSDFSPGDTKVIITRGELICGIVDKRTVGSSANGLIHVTWKEYGAEITSKLISQIQVLINHYLLQRGQSIGVGDTIADAGTMNNVVKTIQDAKEEVKMLIQKAQHRELHLLPGKTMMESFETEVNKVLNGARDKSGSSAQKSLLKSNNIKRMVTAGSKGSFINISQICACVGQQNVEGKRIAYGFRRRTLPHFVVDDLGPESRGFVENSYLRGLTPTEFFFHAMGGREGLIDTAVKTAETGYIQRRLIKAMEDIMVQYDGTVRNSVNHIVEFLYGEDGMDATFLEDQTLGTLKLSDEELREQYYLDVTDPKFGGDGENRYLESELVDLVRQDAPMRLALAEEFRQIELDRDILRKEICKNREEKKPLAVNIDRLIRNAKQEFCITEQSVSNLTPDAVLRGVKFLLKRTRVLVVGDEESIETQIAGEGRVQEDQKPPVVDTLAFEAQENATLLFQIHIRAMLSCKKIIKQHRLNQEAYMWLLGEIENRFMNARCSPGEMIGAVAAQSIGEPATQMTLNTFHYAGVSAKNVTLGVPRLKEIINVSKNTKTPSLTVYLKPEAAMDKEKSKQIQASLQYTALRDVTQRTEIYYDSDPVRTVVDDDIDLVCSYYELEDVTTVSPWVLRIQLDKDMLLDRKIGMDDIEKMISENFGSDMHIIRSQDNADNLVVRLRLTEDSALDKDREAAANGQGGNSSEEEDSDDEDTDDSFLRRIEQEILSGMNLGGIPGIKKVFMRQTKQWFIDDMGKYRTQDEWVLDTEGVNLLAVMSHDSVDHTRTLSNDIVEIFEVLGIEAVRAALLNEVRGVISFDGAYVNYRHLAILVDTMTYRGHLMSITRHGINRVDTAPLMKCSFEETTDILLEASTFGEKDPLNGVTENIMLGQLAPVGTGSFSLALNEKMLKDAIEPEEAMGEAANSTRIGRSPRIDEFDDRPGSAYGTPLRGEVSTPGRKRSFDVPATPSMAYSPVWRPGGAQRGASPFRQAEMSPNAGAQFSPTPSSPNRGGMTPNRAAYTPLQSPGRDYAMATSPGRGMSPYTSASPGFGGGAYTPLQSPGGSRDYSLAASPGRGGSGYGVSPGYRPTSPYAGAASPGGGYSPTSPSYGISPTSPSYSPQNTASYSPTSPSYAASPAATGAAGRGGPSSPGYYPASPAAGGYSPSSPAVRGSYSPAAATGGYAPSAGTGADPNGRQTARSGSVYSPSSPGYSLSSPRYSPT